MSVQYDIERVLCASGLPQNISELVGKEIEFRVRGEISADDKFFPNSFRGLVTGLVVAARLVLGKPEYAISLFVDVAVFGEDLSFSDPHMTCAYSLSQGWRASFGSTYWKTREVYGEVCFL